MGFGDGQNLSTRGGNAVITGSSRMRSSWFRPFVAEKLTGHYLRWTAISWAQCLTIAVMGNGH